MPVRAERLELSKPPALLEVCLLIVGEPGIDPYRISAGCRYFVRILQTS